MVVYYAQEINSNKGAQVLSNILMSNIQHNYKIVSHKETVSYYLKDVSRRDLHWQVTVKKQIYVHMKFTCREY